MMRTSCLGHNREIVEKVGSSQMRKSETVTFRPAWVSYWKSWISIAVILVLSMIRANSAELSSDVQNVLPYLALIPIGGILARVLFHRYSRTYQIEESRRIRNTTGIISRVRREFLISDKIQTDLKQTILGRFLNYGTLRFWTGDEQSGFAWVNVPDPARRETEVKQLVLAGHDTKDHPRKPDEGHRAVTTASSFEALVPQRSLPPKGTQLSQMAVIVPPLPGAIQVLAGEPKFISTLNNSERDYRYVECGDPLIEILVPVRDLFFGRQDFERIVIPSPVTGLVIKTGHSATKEIWDYRSREYNNPDLATMMLTTIIPTSNASDPNQGHSLFGDLYRVLWENRDYIFNRQKTARLHFERGRFGSLKTEDGIRALLDETSTQTCLHVDAMTHFHEYIHEIWFKRHDLRIFLNPLVNEAGLRDFHEIWKTVTWDHNVEASLQALRDASTSQEKDAS